MHGLKLDKYVFLVLPELVLGQGGRRMAEAICASYDVVSNAEEPRKEWPAWILGKQYTLPHGELVVNILPS